MTEEDYLELCREEKRQREIDRKDSDFINRTPNSLEELAAIVYRHHYENQHLGKVLFYMTLSDGKRASLKHWLDIIRKAPDPEE